MEGNADSDLTIYFWSNYLQCDRSWVRCCHDDPLHWVVWTWFGNCERPTHIPSEKSSKLGHWNPDLQIANGLVTSLPLTSNCQYKTHPLQPTQNEVIRNKWQVFLSVSFGQPCVLIHYCSGVRRRCVGLLLLANYPFVWALHPLPPAFLSELTLSIFSLMCNSWSCTGSTLQHSSLLKSLSNILLSLDHLHTPSQATIYLIPLENVNQLLWVKCLAYNEYTTSLICFHMFYNMLHLVYLHWIHSQDSARFSPVSHHFLLLSLMTPTRFIFLSFYGCSFSDYIYY